ncbi:MAG: Ku protein [Pirellulaceae bacterium]
MILEAMREKKRVGIGRMVRNTRERICALEPHDNRILLTTLRTHEDIVTASDVGGIAKLPKPDRRMLETRALCRGGSCIAWSRPHPQLLADHAKP